MNHNKNNDKIAFVGTVINWQKRHVKNANELYTGFKVTKIFDKMFLGVPIHYLFHKIIMN